MVQVELDGQIQPELTVTTSSSGGDATVTFTDTKIKRTRKPWVYKSEYDKLVRKYTIAFGLAGLGWMIAILLIVTQ